MTPLTPSEPGAKEGSEVFEYVPPPYFSASSRVPKRLQHLIADIFSFVMLHYNLWFVPVGAFFYFLYQVGARLRDDRCGGGAHGHELSILFLLWQYGSRLVAIALLALYIPSFVDGSEYTAHGRPWEWMWSTPLWRLTLRQLGCVLFGRCSLTTLVIE